MHGLALGYDVRTDRRPFAKLLLFRVSLRMGSKNKFGNKQFAIYRYVLCMVACPIPPVTGSAK
jgi:hypothetical protein